MKNVVSTLSVLVWLTACGSGSKSAEEAPADGAPSNTDAQATIPSKAVAVGNTAKVDPAIAKGESDQVEVPKDQAKDSAPSLTLTRTDKNKLTWNEVVKAGATYMVYERGEKGSYDFDKPLQSLADVMSLVIAEKPGVNCYLIRAKTLDGTLSVDSNEICIKSAVALEFAPLKPVTLVASEALSLKLAASAGEAAASIICSKKCPDGMTLKDGLLTWNTTYADAGTHTISFKAEAAGASAEQDLVVSVREAFINLTVSTEGESLGEQALQIKATAASNLQGVASLSLIQTAGPQVSLTGQNGNWSFTSPNVRSPTPMAFEVTANLNGLIRKATANFNILPKDHGPSISALTDQTLVATESLSLQIDAQDPDQDTLEYACILNCPQGLTVGSSSGLISWQPSLDQIGTTTSSFRVTANGQFAVTTLSIQVLAPSLSLSFVPLTSVSGENVSLKPAISSNLKAPYQYQITQTSGPAVSLQGPDGDWSFAAPDVDQRTTLSFSIQAGNAIYRQQQDVSVQIEPKPVAPTVQVGGDRLAREALQVTATVSSNAKTLAWKVINGPGRVSFSAQDQLSTRVSADTDGVYEIALSATNASGQEGLAAFHLTWDTQAPQLEVGADVIGNAFIKRSADVLGAKTLLWSKQSGPGALQFSQGDAASTDISADQDGTYVVQLEATDEAGNTARDSFTWTLDRNPPTVSLGDAIITQSRSKALQATVSEDAQTFTWRKVSGPSTVTFTPDNTSATTVTLGGDGVYIIEIIANDALGNGAAAQLQIAVDTQAPLVTAVTLAEVVADGFLNALEKTRSLPLVSGVQATDSTIFTSAYKVVASTTACNNSLVYSLLVPKSDDAAFSKVGAYKVCAKVTDSFNQTTFAASAAFTYDTSSVLAVLSALPSNPSRDTQLAAIVAGSKVTHYRSKIGPSSTTDCSSISGYRAEAPVVQAISDDVQALSDGQVRLCVIGRNASGNWQDLAVATRFDWNLDRVVPEDPSNMTAVSLVQRARLYWDAAKNADGYLLVKSEDQAVTWLPVSGQTYKAGDELDGKHRVVSVGADLQAFDETAVGEHSYHYALFSMDKALNYNTNPSRAGATIISPVSFNQARGFDRLVRVVLPIREGEHKGKILVGGDFLVYQNNAALRLLRLNADLTVDTSFQPTAINGSVYSMALAHDGSLYIGGSFTSVAGKVRNRLARLNGSTGALDESFLAPGFNNTVLTLALDGDQSRLYAGGSFTALTTTPATAANRLVALKTLDGSLENGFSLKASADQTKIGFDNVVWSVATDPSSGSPSDIFVGGQFVTYGGVTVNRLVKLDKTGEIDPSFSLGSGFDNSIIAIKVDSKQQVYAAGSFGRYRGSASYARLIRLKSDGSPDSEFNKGLSTSARFNSTVRALELDEDNNHIYASGDFTAYGTAALSRLARLSLTDGALDSSFLTGANSGANGSVQTLGLADNGKLLAAGNFQKYGTSNVPYFVALNSQGVLAAESPLGTMSNSNIFASVRVYDDANAPQTSVKTFLAGSFTTFQGTTANRVVKLDRFGKIDSSFNSQVTDGSVYALAWDDSEKKLYIGGTFTKVNGIARSRIARLNANGSLDANFVPDGFNSDVYALALANNTVAGTRSLYVGGRFTLTGTIATGRLARLNEDGKLDNSFAIGAGFNNNVSALAVSYSDSDHSVYVGGSFLTYNNGTANAPRIVKLASDGSIASSFEPGAGFNGSVQALVWMAGENALYVGGAFSRYQGTLVANRIAKLDATGGVSVGFNSGTGFNSTVYALDYDADQDLIWVGGAFTQHQGVSQGRIAAMQRNGQRLAAFAATPGFNSDVRALSSSSWGVLASGLGSSYQNAVCGFAARLHPNGSMD